MRLLAMLGALSGAMAVGAGAFGAHALRARLEPRALEVFETAARYQMYHALAIFAAVWMLGQGGRAAAVAGPAGWCFVAGSVVFSGSLYALALSGMRGLGAITPIGGVLFIAGWVLLAVGALRLEG